MEYEYEIDQLTEDQHNYGWCDDRKSTQQLRSLNKTAFAG
jgi:hypothetical protein